MGKANPENCINQLEAELARAHETIARLNRRCQSAERGLAQKINPGPRTFGRILANSAASMWYAWALDMARGILAKEITIDVYENAHQIVNETAGQSYTDLHQEAHALRAALVWLHHGGEGEDLFERHSPVIQTACQCPMARYAAGVKS